MFMRYLNVFLFSFLSYFFDVSSFAGPGDGLLVGFKGGVNFSQVIPLQRFSVTQSLGGASAISAQKEYDPFFRNTGYQYGFVGWGIPF
jgi:hypothetical protein